MKIATIKQELHEGDTITIKGRVNWVSPIKTRHAERGDFKLQSLLVSDGEKDDAGTNSIFCDLNADNGTLDHLKGTDVAIKGEIHVYEGKMSLQKCSLSQQTSRPPQTHQVAPESNNSTKQDTSSQIARMNSLTNAIKHLEGVDKSISDVFSVAGQFYEWITTGEVRGARDEADDFIGTKPPIKF